ncbi:MAG: hypothetical protein JXB05_05400 [Myxococcaceae bacterium]|nr:hypothetical protein [Myxococcaceae bacterium]
MSPTSRSGPLLGLSLLLLTFACGPEEPVPPPTDNTPLFTLEGKLTLEPGHHVDGPVRLALAWYPGMLPAGEATPLSQPQAIATSDTAYPNSLPVSYRFNVLSPPPAAALKPLPEGFHGRGALGLLLAYADGNANARLDTIPIAGPPVDRVLGSSLRWSAAPAFLLVYLDSEQPAETGLRKGFNLVKLTGAQPHAVVPSSTPIPLVLSGGPLLDLFVCEAAWSGTEGEAPCGLELEQPAEALSVTGTVSVYAGILEVDLAVALAGEAVKDAAITLGGERIPFDPDSGRYHASSLDPALLTRAEGAELHVSGRGQELRRNLTASGSFEPQGPYRAKSGAPFTVSWSASAGAQAYNVSLDVGVTRNLGSAIGLGSTEHTFDAIEYTGTAILRVEAVSWLEDAHSSRLEIKVVRTLPMFFEPADEAPPEGTLDVMGTVQLLRYGAETNLLVTRGGVPITDARVLLGSKEVPLDPDTGSYTLVEAIFGSVFDLGPVELRVLSRGEELRRTLAAPAAFAVLSPTLPANPQSGAPFTVSWESSVRAQEYRVMIVGDGAGILAMETTSALETTFSSVVHSGLATLYVQAVTFVPGSDLGGSIEIRREHTLPLRFEP